MKEFNDTKFPKFSQALEDKYKDNGTKYLVSDEITLADIVLAAHIFKVYFNQEFTDGHNEKVLE